MLSIKALSNVTLTGASDLGQDVVLRTGDRYSISDESVKRKRGGFLAPITEDDRVLTELVSKRDAGSISISIVEEPGKDYTSIRAFLEGREDAQALGAGEPTGDLLTGALLNTNAEAGTWSDILATIQANAGTTGGTAVTVYPNPSAANAAFYIGSDDPIHGFEVRVRAGKAGGDSAVITAQYWDGGSWVTFNTMAADRVEPFTRRWVGSSLFNTAGGISIWFDRNTVGLQATKSLNGSTARYWIRFTISSGTIAASAITITRLRLHQSASVFSATGVRVNYGGSRRGELVVIPLDYVPTTTPAVVADVLVSANITLRGIVSHAAGSDTAIMGQLVIQPWMDVSSRLTLALSYKAVLGVGTVQWRATVSKVKNGDTEAGAVAEATASMTRNAAGANVIDRFLFTTTFDISDMQIGDIVAIKIERLGSADTNAGAAHRRELLGYIYRCLEGSGL